MLRRKQIVTVVIVIGLLVALYFGKDTYVIRAIVNKLTLLTQAQRLAALRPEAREALINVRSDLMAQGIPTYVGSTHREAPEQAKKVAAGLSATNHSWHLLDLAVDLYPLLPSGKPDLNGTNIELFRKMHAVAAKHGFSGLAFNSDGSIRRITTMKNGVEQKTWDGAHLEYRNGMTWNEAATLLGVA